MTRPLNAPAAHLVGVVDFAEGGGVVVDAGVAADEAAAADGDEVVHAHAAHEVAVVADACAGCASQSFGGLTSQ